MEYEPDDKNMKKKAENIAKGFNNLLQNKEEFLSIERMKICKECEIYYKNFCLTKLGGCGCFLPAKTRVIDEQCPLNKW